LKANEIEKGEIAIYYDEKFIGLKLSDEKYHEVKFIITNYKIYLNVNNRYCTKFPLSNIEDINKYEDNKNILK
jgi:hypothetical protein